MGLRWPKLLIILVLLTVIGLSCYNRPQKAPEPVRIAQTVQTSEAQRAEIEKLTYDYMGAMDVKDFLGFMNVIADETLLENVAIYEQFRDPQSHIRVKRIRRIDCIDSDGPCEVRLDLVTTHAAFGGMPIEYEDTRLIVRRTQEGKWVVVVPF